MRAIALTLSMLLVTSINNLSTQNELVDSLRHELETATSDTALLNINLALFK
ncbi:MAG: hypothetical protein ACI8P3_000670 [Saprospiraceae bacterium]|jgi:hypothetical protein